MSTRHFCKVTSQLLFLLKVKWNVLSCVLLFATPWTVACQAPLSMEFSRPEYWSGWPFPSPADLPNPGIKPRSPALQADFYHLRHCGSPRILEWVIDPFSSRSSFFQKSNRGLLQCRWILYLLSYQGRQYYFQICEFPNSCNWKLYPKWHPKVVAGTIFLY